METRKTVQLSY